MRNIPRWAWIVGGVVLVGVALRLTVLRPKPVEVRAARAGLGEVEEIVANTRAGTVKVRERSKLSPQIGGRVVALPYAKGDRVPAGGLLLKLDDSVQQAQLQLARDELKTAEAKSQEACLAADLAQKQFERGSALAADGIASKDSLDTLESARDQTRAACNAAKAAVEQSASQVRLAEAELALTEVRAPFAGVLADCSTHVGEWITPSPPGVPIPPVLDFFSPASAYVSAPIDEVDSTRVRPGMEVRITVESKPGEHFAGRLGRVAPYVLDLQEQNRTVEVEVTFDNPEKAAGILPGTSTDVEIVLSRAQDVLRIPTAAVAEGNQVLVVESGRLESRTLTPGLKNWQFTQVLSGLKPGDVVVTARDSTAIKPGARVRARVEP
jgi:HlyD family secretion protein